MHEKGCSCCACVQIRGWLRSQATGGEGGHPVCCVCPLCAAPRIAMRSSLANAIHEHAHRGTNSWWTNTQEASDPWVAGDSIWKRIMDMYRAMHGADSFSGGGKISNPFRRYEANSDAQRRALDDAKQQAREDASVAAFDLLADMNIPIRKEEP